MEMLLVLTLLAVLTVLQLLRTATLVLASLATLGVRVPLFLLISPLWQMALEQLSLADLTLTFQTLNHRLST